MLGNCIRNCREESNLTQEDLAERVGISRTMISKIESNKAKPSLITLQKIAKALDIPTSELLKDDNI